MQPGKNNFLTLKQINISIDPIIYNKLNTERVSLTKWEINQIGNFCQHIEEWRISKISSTFFSDKDDDYRSAKNMIKEISHINFPYLKQIWFLKIYVESIEAMSRIWAPVL